MAAALDPLSISPRSWHTVGLDFLTHLPFIACFDNVLVVVCRSLDADGTLLLL
jgi:hypothetical protein